MIGEPHPHATARGYSRPAPDPIVAPAQSSREGSAGIRVRARNARLTQGTEPVETAAAVQMGMVAFGRLSLDHFHRCLQKPPQKTLPAFAQLRTGRRRFITIILERTKTGEENQGNNRLRHQYIEPFLEHARGRDLPLAFLKQPFQRFHTKGLKAGVIIEGELTQLVVQLGREPEQHPFRRARAGTPRRLRAAARISPGRSMHCVRKAGFTIHQGSKLRVSIQTVH